MPQRDTHNRLRYSFTLQPFCPELSNLAEKLGRTSYITDQELWTVVRVSHPMMVFSSLSLSVIFVRLRPPHTGCGANERHLRSAVRT